MVGGITGLSAIHGGLPLSGLSLAVVDALVCGTKYKGHIKALPGGLCRYKTQWNYLQTSVYSDGVFLLLTDEWSEEETSQISNLCLEWYCRANQGDK